MSSQNNSGQQHQKRFAITMVAMAIVAANRLLAYDGTYATSAGGVKDAQGVSETDAAVGEAVSAVTDYSYLVEASVPIAFGDYIKPAADGSGRAAVGTLTDHCGRALGATTAAGQRFEMQIVRHVHA
ncbi:MAG: DUF2190 domain-containing protein [Polaromonas sp.]